MPAPRATAIPVAVPVSGTPEAVAAGAEAARGEPDDGGNAEAARGEPDDGGNAEAASGDRGDGGNGRRLPVSVATAGSTSETAAGLPWPEGDPGSLSSAASTVGSGADSLRTAATRLEGEAGGAAGWQGEAAIAFRAAVAQDHALMVKGAGALEQAAAALKRLSTTLSDA